MSSTAEEHGAGTTCLQMRHATRPCVPPSLRTPGSTENIVRFCCWQFWGRPDPLVDYNTTGLSTVMPGTHRKEPGESSKRAVPSASHLAVCLSVCHLPGRGQGGRELEAQNWH